MIKLYSFGSAFGVVDPSPFVLKVDAYMRLANIEFENIPNMDNLRKAPKGKLPFIIDGKTTVADSEFIISYLQQKYQITLDEHLSPQQKSTAYLLGKSLDENLYWCLVYSRWVKDKTWADVKKAFFDDMPFPLKHIVPLVARHGVISAIKKQGLGNHSEQEINLIANKTFQALSTILGDKTYFFADKPSSFDATAYGFLAEFIQASVDNEMNQLARQHPNLVAFCAHIHSNYYL